MPLPRSQIEFCGSSDAQRPSHLPGRKSEPQTNPEWPEIVRISPLSRFFRYPHSQPRKRGGQSSSKAAIRSGSSRMISVFASKWSMFRSWRG